MQAESPVTFSAVLLFAPYRLDLKNQELWRGWELVALRPRSFAVLSYLARNPQRLITKHELLKSIWADVAVNEELLRGYIRELRLVLQDDAGAPRFVATVAKRGYRFLPEVTVLGHVPVVLNRDDGAERELTSGADLGASAEAGEQPASRPSGSTAITVGILHSLTGTMAWTETPVVDATLLAIEEVNHKGGIGGRPVRALLVDGQSNERVFAREAERLIVEEGVRTLFGCWMSSSRKAAQGIIEKHDGLLFYPVQSEGMEQSPNIVYTGAAPNQQILPAVRWAFGFLHDKRFFLVGGNSVHSWAVNAVIRDEVEALGGEIVGEEYLSANSDVSEVIRKIARIRPDLIFNSLAGDINIFYSRALRAAGLTPDNTPSLYFGMSEVELLSFSPAENVGDYAAWNYFQSLRRAENRMFIDRFRSRYGPRRVLSDPMEAAYVGVRLWAQAVEAAGSDEVPAVRGALSEQRLEAPEGPVWVDRETQYTWKTMRLGRIVEGGQFEIVWSSERPIRPEPFPSSRSQADWQAFLEGLFQRWNGHWTALAQ